MEHSYVVGQHVEARPRARARFKPARVSAAHPDGSVDLIFSDGARVQHVAAALVRPTSGKPHLAGEAAEKKPRVPGSRGLDAAEDDSSDDEDSDTAALLVSSKHPLRRRLLAARSREEVSAVVEAAKRERAAVTGESGGEAAEARSADDACSRMLRHVLRHSRRVTRARTPYGAPMTPAYRMFLEARTKRMRRKHIVDVTVWLDASAYKGHVRGQRKPGSVVLMFEFYAKIFSPSKQLSRRTLTYDEILRANNTLSFGEFLCLAKDTKITPQLLTKGELHLVWESLHRSKEDVFFQEMNYAQFLELLVRVALLAFEKRSNFEAAGGLPDGASAFAPLRKVSLLIAYMRLDDLRFIRRFLDTTGSATAARMNMGASADGAAEKEAAKAFLRKGEGGSDDAAALYQAIASEQYRASLRAPLLQYEVDNSDTDWQQLAGSPHLDIGVVPCGSRHRFQLRVTNKCRDKISVDVNMINLRDVELGCKTKPLPCGLKRVVNLTAVPSGWGETLGWVVLHATNMRTEETESVLCPVYMRSIVRGQFFPPDKLNQLPIDHLAPSRAGSRLRRKLQQLRTGAAASATSRPPSRAAVATSHSSRRAATAAGGRRPRRHPHSRLHDDGSEDERAVGEEGSGEHAVSSSAAAISLSRKARVPIAGGTALARTHSAPAGTRMATRGLGATSPPM
eukprot:PLAT5515.1.p1 GENE.PLAT5515.1~~PLAT5515.1.p1  ORF type:complete len:681 (+),score=304.80 PLAT5515.1:59-2101(+)